MPTSSERSAYEEGLARAHRALYWATTKADAAGDEGAVEDLTALMTELSRLMDTSLRGRKVVRRQTSLPTNY